MAQATVQAPEIVLGTASNRRRQLRVQLPISAQVHFDNTREKSRIAYIRDVNILGAFLYCDLEVALGDTLQIELTPEQANPCLNLNCEAEVVRVEEQAMNGLTGIAVQFHGFEVEEPSPKKYDIAKPFLRWTVEMVDQMFARRPELQMYASRIQGAA